MKPCKAILHLMCSCETEIVRKLHGQGVLRFALHQYPNRGERGNCFWPHSLIAGNEKAPDLLQLFCWLKKTIPTAASLEIPISNEFRLY